MPLLDFHNLTKSFGENILFSDFSMPVEKHDIIGLIGANGVGKTTLFKMIIGSEQPDDGAVIKSSGVTVGYLEQHACSSSDKTAYVEAISVFDSLIDTENKLDEVNFLLNSSHSDKLIEKQISLYEYYTQNGGLTYKSRTKAVLTGLGFSDEQQGLTVSSLSGGQRSKIGLAKLLLSDNDIILLDEPTNHLDIESVAWLEDFIVSFGSAAIVISHDRFFLDKVTNKTIEIENRKIYFSQGNYSRYNELKKQRLEAERNEYENKLKEIKRIEGIIEQQRRWNREKNIKTAESKQKQIDRIQKTLIKPESENHSIKFNFECESHTGETVLSVFDDSCKFDDEYLYKNVSFTVKRGERIFLTGPNGVGKTTLIRRIMSGKNDNIEFGVGVIPAYFDQFQESIDMSLTPFDEIHNEYRLMTDTAVRNALAAFEFYRDDVFRKNSELSGGERAKVAICKIMLSKNNFLILDEPTNHLDIYSSEALENALKQYKGTLLIVSHDRFFINSLADKIIYLRSDGSLTVDGNYDNYLKYAEKFNTIDKIKAEVSKKSPGKQSYFNEKKFASDKRKAKNDVENSEKSITVLEDKISGLNTEINCITDDYVRLTELTECLQATQKELDRELENWTALNEKLESYFS